jgi:hypothetical protein
MPALSSLELADLPKHLPAISFSSSRLRDLQLNERIDFFSKQQHAPTET